MNRNNRVVCRYLVCMVVLAALANAHMAQKVGRSPEPAKGARGGANLVAAPNAAVPIINFGNSHSSCGDLNDLHVNGVGDVRFAHILTDWELRLNLFNPTGTYPFTTGGGRVVTGPEDALRSVTLTSGSAPGAFISSWSSNLPITAVIMRVGLTTYVFPYQPFRLMDTDLQTNDANFYVFTSFCFGEPTGPTAGEAEINGRVVQASGRGIAKVQLVLINGATGEARTALTNAFGYYTFSGLEPALYVLHARHKLFTFHDSQRTVALTDSFTVADFVADQ